MVKTITFEDFLRVEMRVGKIIKVEDFLKAQKRAYKLTIDFGKLGIKKSSAQITKDTRKNSFSGGKLWQLSIFHRNK